VRCTTDVVGTFKTSRCFWQDILLAGVVAAVTSGAPSTLWAWWTGGDVLEATRAVGAMLIPAQSNTVELLGAATLVHVSVSLFWVGVLTPPYCRDGIRLLPLSSPPP
jgi:hypothetical protein